jgi:hypothetical protein
VIFRASNPKPGRHHEKTTRTENKNQSKFSTTKRKGIEMSAKSRKTNGAGRPKNRSPKKTPPELYVRYRSEDGTEAFAHVHLQNTGGYLYLVWRQGPKVKRRYLGKAPRASTTSAAAAGARRRGLGRAGPGLR